jgi:hypothetical protein
MRWRLLAVGVVGAFAVALIATVPATGRIRED